MLGTVIFRLVDVCTRRAWWVLVIAALTTGFCGVYAVRNFAVNTDTKALFPPNLPWAQQRLPLYAGFPGARHRRRHRGADRRKMSPRRPTGSARRCRAQGCNPCRPPAAGRPVLRTQRLALSANRRGCAVDRRAAKASPLLATLSADPSLRGALDALVARAGGGRGRGLAARRFGPPMNQAADIARAALAGRPASFSWQALASGNAAQPQQLRRFIEIEPKLDYQGAATGLLRRRTRSPRPRASRSRPGEYQAGSI